MLDCVKAKVHFDPERTIMVGDRLNTDILFGQNGGLTTLLVFTGSSFPKVNDLRSNSLRLGITSEDEITGPSPSPIVPDFVTQALGDGIISARIDLIGAFVLWRRGAAEIALVRVVQER